MNPNSSTTPLYLLADDLAGAHDAAISFAKRGFAVAVLSDPDRLDRFDSADIVVLDTNTRSCVEAEAIERVGAACKAIQARSGTIIYKKIDSTLRGHVGLELDLVCSMMDFNLAVCAPAFPELGRTTVGGYQLLHGVPVRRADMAGPDIPPQHAFIADLLGNASKRETVRIDLKTVLGGSAAIQRAIAGIKADQGSTVVVDMADPGCWTGMLDAVLGDSTESTEARDKVTQMGSTLLCGSAGMAPSRKGWPRRKIRTPLHHTGDRAHRYPRGYRRKVPSSFSPAACTTQRSARSRKSAVEKRRPYAPSIPC